MVLSYDRTPENVDPFYTNKGEWDDVEIPLIKPYQLVKLNRHDDWDMSLEQSFMLGDVKKLNVLKSYIFVYSKKTYFNYQAPIKPGWVVINTSKKLEKTFETYIEYVKFLKENGFVKDPMLYNVDDIAAYSRTHDVMDWKELNKNLKP
jgi:hypothetical protein